MELANEIKTALGKTFALQVLITAMLNKVHIHILTPFGDLHTHDFNPGDFCSCAVHMAIIKHNGETKFIVLNDMSDTEIQELHRWETCEVFKPKFPESKSSQQPGKIFQSASVNQKVDTDTVTLPAMQDEPLDLSMDFSEKAKPPGEEAQDFPLDLRVLSHHSPHLAALAKNGNGDIDIDKKNDSIVVVHPVKPQPQHTLPSGHQCGVCLKVFKQ